MNEKVIRQTVQQVSEQLSKEFMDGSFIEKIRKQYEFENFTVKDPTVLTFLFAKTFSENLVTEVLIQLLCDSPTTPEDS